jgi:ABC-2 type transport system ATP-binding protein
MLTRSRGQVTAGAAQFASPGAGGGFSTSYTAPNADTTQPPPTDTPGTFAAYDTPPLAANLDSVGIPTLDVRLSSPTAEQTQKLGPSGELILFAKIYDVAPDGSVTLVHRLIAPVRIADVTKPLHLELPGVVHRYAAGHRIRLVIAASDASYQNNRLPQTVSVLTSPGAPGVLTVPVLPSR